ncbi:MAG: glycosyltransferase family 4 protein [Candidatus Omnitrophota bacterium]
MKVLFLVPYPTEGASNRIRVEQFLPFLEENGVKYRVRPFINKRFYDILYLPYHYVQKAFWFAICTINRILDLARAVGYDVIFIHREAFPFGGAIIESILHRMGKPIVFDFDDAIFLPNTSSANIYIDRFKSPGKVARIIGMSKCVIAGNNYLKQFALKFNKNVIVIPSSIDTGKYKRRLRSTADGEVVIGWMGSGTTKDFLHSLEPVFAKLSGMHKNITFKLVGAGSKEKRQGNVIYKKWKMEEELADLNSFDIGIMPLPDTEWAKGKCGFKAILYMACGLPVVVSPVGANLDIVDDGVNGFFASNEAEWVNAVSKLAGDEGLRRAMGGKGREKVMQKYSLQYTAPLFLKCLVEAYE